MAEVFGFPDPRGRPRGRRSSYFWTRCSSFLCPFREWTNAWKISSVSLLFCNSSGLSDKYKWTGHSLSEFQQPRFQLIVLIGLLCLAFLGVWSLMEGGCGLGDPVRSFCRAVDTAGRWSLLTQRVGVSERQEEVKCLLTFLPASSIAVLPTVLCFYPETAENEQVPGELCISCFGFQCIWERKKVKMNKTKERSKNNWPIPADGKQTSVDALY